jgi:hypothetical protein
MYLNPQPQPQPLDEISANVCVQIVSRDEPTDFNGRILGFLDRSRYSFFQVAPQLYSRV